MNKNYFLLFICIALLFNLNSCKSDDESTYIPTSPVNYDETEAPYAKLSEYNFFEGNMADLEPVYGVLPYEPISQLFTDYAKKKRFIWMPSDVKANYVADHKIMDFPDGTIIIKNFYYNNVLPDNVTKIIETRLLIKKTAGWIFANYVWNDEQTEAFIDTNGSTVNIEWNQNGQTKNTAYKIPSEAECLTCHKVSNTATPIGVKPQSLNSDYAFSDGTVNQLSKWVTMGYLDDNIPANINTVVKWDDPTQPLDLRARSYLDINCAHCHIDDAHCSYRPIRLAFNDTTDPTNLGECVVPDENIDPTLIYVVFPNRPERSVMHFRMQSTNEATRMPLIGRTLVHEEGVQLIEDWINSLTNNCN